MKRKVLTAYILTAYILALAALTAAVLVAATNDSTDHHHPAPPRHTVACSPPRGAGVMGGCVPRTFTSGPPKTLHARFIPDVSEFQGRPNWRAAKAWGIAGAIARIEDASVGSPDTRFFYNWHELQRLHIWHAAYYFLRPGDCAAEGRRAVRIVHWAGGLDSGPIIADAEVPLNYGCAAAFSAAVERATGWHAAVDYTAAGTWPGGPHGHAMLWDAAYGPEPGCVWTCARVAWQFTDGKYGPAPHCISGVGCDDISRDEGITRLVRPRRVSHRQELRSDYRTRTVLRRLLTRHHCRPPAHAVPRHDHTVCGRWLREGAAVNRDINRLRRLR